MSNRPLTPDEARQMFAAQDEARANRAWLEAERERGRCGQPVRGDEGGCQLDAGHRGHHSTVTFGCDGCGKRYRGRPHATAPDGEYPHGLQFCFLCSAEQGPAGRDAYRHGEG